MPVYSIKKLLVAFFLNLINTLAHVDIPEITLTGTNVNKKVNS